MPLTLNGTTGISFPDGSSGAPALRGADADTGVFFPAADTIALVEGGTEVLRINSSANIGIGTTTPNFIGVNSNSRCLSIVGDGTITNARGTLELRNPIADASGNTLGSIYFSGGSNVANYAEIRVVSSGSGGANGFGNELRFATKDDNGTTSNKMFLTSAGNLGIGTANPQTVLHVRSGSSGGSVYPLSSAVIEGSTYGYLDIKSTGAGGINFGDASQSQAGVVEYDHSADYMRFVVNSGERLRITSAGNIGIGTTIPFTKLDTRGALHVGGGTDGIWLGNAGDNAAYDNVKLYYSGYNSGSPRVYLTPRTQPGSGSLTTYLHLLSNNVPGPGANNMGLIVDGSVGIGTTAPQTKLHLVNGGIVGGGGRGGIYTKTLFESNDSVGAYWEFQTTPTSTVNDILFSRGTSGAYGVVGYNNNTNEMRFFTNSNQQMVIGSTGNVGIGTTNPLYKLDVRGGSWINGASIQGASVSFGASPVTKTITISTSNTEAITIVASGFTSGGGHSAVKQFMVGGYIPGSTQYAAATVSSATTGSSMSISDITKANNSFSFTMTLSTSLNSQGEISVLSRFPVTITIS